MDALIFANGPAIKLVGVAEQMEVVTRKALQFRAGSRHTTVMSEAWTIFCRPGTNLVEHYACRDTKLLASRSQVKVHKVL